ncbi:TPA: hypothetical protein QIM57_002308 [Morganella morganii subsp. morganii]|nr:hypothetical protein [Morganella morganii subsp. morganii]
MEAFAALLAAIGTMVYWYYCRVSSMSAREDLAEAASNILDDEDISVTLKRSTYMAYYLSTKWWSVFFWFVVIVIMIPILGFTNLNKRLAKNDDNLNKVGKTSNSAAVYNSLMDKAVVYISKRSPLLFTALSVFTVIAFAFAILINAIISKINPKVISLHLSDLTSITNKIFTIFLIKSTK